MMVSLMDLMILRNHLIDLRERAIGVDHVSKIQLHRDLLYSGAGI